MGLEGLGPKMSLDDTQYTSGAPFKAGTSGTPPPSKTPGFDSGLLPKVEALLGRWVRSPSKFVGWDQYMVFFGMTGDKALQETEEPQEHVIESFSPGHLHIVHRLPWRDGLDTEYTMPIDGSVQPVPPAMVARASSSWKVNDLMSWVHSWDEGDDGNPLHRGLRTDQKMKIGGTDYTLRYWRNLIRPNEMRINVEVTYADTGKMAIHTQRYFHKIDIDRDYAIAALPASDAGDCPFPATLSCWTHNARAVRLVMLPHASNMPKDWEKLNAELAWEMADSFPHAGRDSGRYLSAVRAEAAQQKLWVCCGVVLRSKEADDKKLLRGVALIGADGWLHAVHTDADVPDVSVYAKGTGEWPATQRARPFGVYDTELGRIAIVASNPDADTVGTLTGMGAELILSPPLPGAGESRVAVTVADRTTAHDYYTKYELCGPEALPKPEAEARLPVIVQAQVDGNLQVVGGPASSLSNGKATGGYA